MELKDYAFSSELIDFSNPSNVTNSYKASIGGPRESA